jgi:hypothetical protein
MGKLCGKSRTRQLYPKVLYKIMVNMKTVTITRVKTGVDGTFGILNVEDLFTCVTLEPPWKDNQKNISCIPVGEYMVKPHISTQFQNVRGRIYRIMDVPERTGIDIHPGNRLKDTKGCPMLGLYRTIYENQEIIADSVSAFRLYSQIVKRHTHKLIIKNDYGFAFPT